MRGISRRQIKMGEVLEAEIKKEISAIKDIEKDVEKRLEKANAAEAERIKIAKAPPWRMRPLSPLAIEKKDSVPAYKIILATQSAGNGETFAERYKRSIGWNNNRVCYQ